MGSITFSNFNCELLFGWTSLAEIPSCWDWNIFLWREFAFVVAVHQGSCPTWNHGNLSFWIFPDLMAKVLLDSFLTSRSLWIPVLKEDIPLLSRFLPPPPQPRPQQGEGEPAIPCGAFWQQVAFWVFCTLRTSHMSCVPGSSLWPWIPASAFISLWSQLSLGYPWPLGIFHILLGTHKALASIYPASPCSVLEYPLPFYPPKQLS